MIEPLFQDVAEWAEVFYLRLQDCRRSSDPVWLQLWGAETRFIHLNRLSDAIGQLLSAAPHRDSQQVDYFRNRELAALVVATSMLIVLAQNVQSQLARLRHSIPGDDLRAVFAEFATMAEPALIVLGVDVPAPPLGFELPNDPADQNGTQQ